MRGKTNKEYAIGLVMMVLGGASLADHICYGIDAFPISAVIFGLGFYLIARSYSK